MKDKSANKITTNCAICNSSVYIDQYGNGKCEICGWWQSELGEHNVTEIVPPNLISFANAKKSIKAGFKITPTVYDFAQASEQHGEMDFWYKDRRFGIITLDDGVKFYQWGTKGTIQTFLNIAEFVERAPIDGRLIKDIWHEVENPDYL